MIKTDMVVIRIVDLAPQIPAQLSYNAAHAAWRCQSSVSSVPSCKICRKLIKNEDRLAMLL